MIATFRCDRKEQPHPEVRSLADYATLCPGYEDSIGVDSMVGTYSCYNCLNPIPANTLVCPYCGQVQRRGARINDPKVYLAIILSAIVLIGWNWYSGGQKTHAVTSPPSATIPSR
jgi:hypothetical protein